MPFNFDEGELDSQYFGDSVNASRKVSHEVNPATPDIPTTSEGVGGVGGETYVCKDLRSIYSIYRRFEIAVLPPTPPTADEQRFFDLTGHLPGDAWEGELPDDGLEFDGVQLARSIQWPEVMQAAAEERTWGRKSTLALMWPCHEGRFDWYEHPITKKWHSYASFPK